MAFYGVGIPLHSDECFFDFLTQYMNSWACISNLRCSANPAPLIFGFCEIGYETYGLVGLVGLVDLVGLVNLNI